MKKPRTEASAKALRGTLFYDGTCGLCVGSANRLRPHFGRLGVASEPFSNGAAEFEMKLRWEDGSLRGGGNVIFFLARRMWWSAPLGCLGWVPGCRWLVGKLYDVVASRRRFLGDGACQI